MRATQTSTSRPAVPKRRQWVPPTAEPVSLGAEVTSYAGAEDPYRN